MMFGTIRMTVVKRDHSSGLLHPPQAARIDLTSGHTPDESFDSTEYRTSASPNTPDWNDTPASMPSNHT
jgi:hypothetical protein